MCGLPRRFIHLLLFCFLGNIIPLALAQAKPSNAVSEQVAARTERSKKWSLQNGGTSVEVYSTPIHYKDIDGFWQDVDTKLSPSAKPDYGYSVVQNRFKSFLAPNAKGLQTIEADSGTISFQPDAQTNSRALQIKILSHRERHQDKHGRKEPCH